MVCVGGPLGDAAFAIPVRNATEITQGLTAPTVHQEGVVPAPPLPPEKLSKPDVLGHPIVNSVNSFASKQTVLPSVAALPSYSISFPVGSVASSQKQSGQHMVLLNFDHFLHWHLSGRCLR